MFMKDDITGGENFMGEKIIYLITLLTKWVTKENTTTSTGVKLSDGCEVGGITKAPKNS